MSPGESTFIDSSIAIPIIDSFPCKKLITQEGGHKFGLINKHTMAHGAFVHKEYYNTNSYSEDGNPTLKDVMDKVEETMCSQQFLLKTVLNHNQHLSAQIESLKKQVSLLK